MRADNSINFSIEGNDLKILKKFERQHKNCGMGFACDKFTYSFYPTSLGLGISVKCSCGQSLPLGDPLDLGKENVYDKEKYRPLTDEDKPKNKTEEIFKELSWLRRKSGRRIGFLLPEPPGYQYIEAFLTGIVTTLWRIGEAPKAPYDYRKTEQYKSESEEEKIIGLLDFLGVPEEDKR